MGISICYVIKPIYPRQSKPNPSPAVKSSDTMGTTDRSGSAAVKKRKRQKLPPKKSTSKETKNDVKYSSDKIKSNGKKKKEIEAKVDKQQRNDAAQLATASQQLEFFVHQYQSGNGAQLSSLELDSLKGDLCRILRRRIICFSPLVYVLNSATRDKVLAWSYMSQHFTFYGSSLEFKIKFKYST